MDMLLVPSDCRKRLFVCSPFSIWSLTIVGGRRPLLGMVRCLSSTMEHGLSWHSLLSILGLGNSSYNINTIDYWCAENSEGLSRFNPGRLGVRESQSGTPLSMFCPLRGSGRAEVGPSRQGRLKVRRGRGCVRPVPLACLGPGMQEKGKRETVVMAVLLLWSSWVVTWRRTCLLFEVSHVEEGKRGAHLSG